MESRLDDEKRLKEILAMLKSRLQMSFQSSGHTTSALRALSYGSPLSKFKDDTDGIGFYEVVRGIEEHFEEKKAELIQNLKQLSRQIFRVDNVMISYTSSEDGLTPIEAAFREIKIHCIRNWTGKRRRVYYTAENATKALKRLPKCSMWQELETLSIMEHSIMARCRF